MPPMNQKLNINGNGEIKNKSEKEIDERKNWEELRRRKYLAQRKPWRISMQMKGKGELGFNLFLPFITAILLLSSL